MKKSSSTGKKVLEVALLGAAFGIAAGVLVGSKFGKKLGKDINKKSGEFYKYLAPQLKKAKKMSEIDYKALINRAAERYSKDKKLSVTEAEHLIKEALASWAHLKKNL